MEYAGLGGATALIMALVQIAKKAGLPSRFAGLLAVALGVGAGLLSVVALDGPGYLNGAAAGLVVGLAASGAYSGGKALVK